MMRWQVALAVPFLALGSEAGDGGSAGWMFTGSRLADLRNAVIMDLVRLSDDTNAAFLRGQIVSFDLKALYLPPCNDKSHCIVYRSLNDQAEAYPLKLKRGDFDELTAFEVRKILRLAQEIRQAVAVNDASARDIAYGKIATYLSGLANKERVEAAERFIGMQLADLHPRDERLLPYLVTYREFVQESAMAAIKNRTASERLVEGNIYYYGVVDGVGNGSALPDLATRKTLDVDGKEYQSVWVGRTFAVILPLDSPPTGFVDPYKLGAKEFFISDDQKDFAFPGKFAWEPLVPIATSKERVIG